MTGAFRPERARILGAAALAVIGACAFLPGSLDSLGEDVSAAHRTWVLSVSFVAAAGFLLLVVRLALGLGWGARGPGAPVAPFGGREILVLLVAYLGVQFGLAGLQSAEVSGRILLIAVGAGNVGLTVLALLLWRTAAWSESLLPYAVVRRDSILPDLLWGAGLGLAFQTLAGGLANLGRLALEAVGRSPDLQTLVQQVRDEPDVLVVALMFVFAAILAPLWEEILFRGILYGAARRLVGPIPAAVATGLLFAVIHQSIYAAVPLFALGVALALLYERTRSLLAPMACHALFNTLQFVSILLLRNGAS